MSKQQNAKQPQANKDNERQRQNAELKALTLTRGVSQEQARLATDDQSDDQSEGKCWWVMHNAEEQSGSEQWESGAYIVERGAASWAWSQGSGAGVCDWLESEPVIWSCVQSCQQWAGCIQNPNCARFGQRQQVLKLAEITRPFLPAPCLCLRLVAPGWMNL